MTFYDSVTGLALFVAPRGRSWDDFVAESTKHRWPSFRDEEVVRVRDRVRVRARLRLRLRLKLRARGSG